MATEALGLPRPDNISIEKKSFGVELAPKHFFGFNDSDASPVAPNAIERKRSTRLVFRTRLQKAASIDDLCSIH